MTVDIDYEIICKEDFGILKAMDNIYIDRIEEALDIKLLIGDEKVVISGPENQVKDCKTVLDIVLSDINKGICLNPDSLEFYLEQDNIVDGKRKHGEYMKEAVAFTFDNKVIKVKSHGQRYYVDAVKNNDLTFCLGPAGTGKTFLAVLLATEALRKKDVKRIVLVRPAVEAGEQLGFLPGDLQEKIQPYIRPLYDSLYYLLGVDQVERLIERKVIEIAPLAYMRGRTLDDAFIILDEGQNATIEQMKMFLTRFGFNSKVVVTGDPTQDDLKKGEISGLGHAVRMLRGIKGIKVINLNKNDVVRHRLVKEIIEAYEKGGF